MANNIISDVEGALKGINVSELLQVASAAEAALPAIEAGAQAALPYITAFITVIRGGTPTADDWAALDARLDAGSAALSKSANEGTP